VDVNVIGRMMATTKKYCCHTVAFITVKCRWY